MTAPSYSSQEEEISRLRARVEELEQCVRGTRSSDEALEESRALLQTFLSYVPVCAWIKDEEQRYVYANRQMQSFLERKGLSWSGLTDFDLWPAPMAQDWQELDRAAAMSPGPLRRLQTVPDGTGHRSWSTCRLPFTTATGKKYVIGIAEDVTENRALEARLLDRSRAEESARSQALALLESLRRSESKAQRLFHTELIGIMECEGGVVVDANDALLGWLGLTRDDLASFRIRWRDLTANRFRALDDELLIQLRTSGKCQPFEKDMIAQDGHSVPVMCCATALDSQKESFLSIVVNLAERREIQSRLLRSQKLESLGLIAGGVAHDFNNLLATIMGNSSLSLDALTPDHPAYGPVSEVLIGSRRASILTQQMLAYAGRAAFSIRSIDLSQMVDEIGSLLETTISKKITLGFHLSQNIGLIEGDEGQIQQVIMNLVINASDAIGENPGQISVSTYRCDSSRQNFVCFEVRDTGCGMDEETKRRIFDPFFTTKANGRGLGLAAVMGAVKNHGGSLTVESNPGVGTTFRVFLPLSASPARLVREQSSERLSGSGTILVVDDDEAIRRMTRSSLERFGYQVILAEDGADAVASFARHRAEISVVLLDWAMPVMNGEEALRQILAIDPSAKVLLSSGYAEIETMERIGSGALAGFLQKPYTASQLARRLREVLGSTTEATADTAGQQTQRL